MAGGWLTGIPSVIFRATASPVMTSMVSVTVRVPSVAVSTTPVAGEFATTVTDLPSGAGTSVTAVVSEAVQVMVSPTTSKPLASTASTARSTCWLSFSCIAVPFLAGQPSTTRCPLAIS